MIRFDQTEWYVTRDGGVRVTVGEPLGESRQVGQVRYAGVWHPNKVTVAYGDPGASYPNGGTREFYPNVFGVVIHGPDGHERR